MKNILILIDVQQGFTGHDSSRTVIEKIKKLLQSQCFDYVIATKFLNVDNSIYENLLNWHALKTDKDRELCNEIKDYVDVTVDKEIYTCVNTQFIQMLCRFNDGQYPQKIFIAGIDTDCCVLKTAVDLFENNIRPVVLSEYCYSNGGQNSHMAGILCMKRLIGKKQIYDKEIQCKDDLNI